MITIGVQHAPGVLDNGVRHCDPSKNVIEVGSQPCGIDDGQSTPALHQNGGWNGMVREWAQLSDRLASGRGESFASCNPFQHVSAVISEFPHGDVAHSRLSPVRPPPALRGLEVCGAAQVE